MTPPFRRSVNQIVTLIFVLLVSLLCFAMKLAALLRMPKGPSTWAFVFAPVAAPTSLRRRNPIHAPAKLLGRALLFSVLVILWEWLCRTGIPQFNARGIALPYLAAPTIYLLGESLGYWVAFLGGLFAHELPFVLDSPLRSHDLADFWSRRWNVWFSDWFRFVILAPMNRRPVAAVWVVFLVSGLMHEAVIDGPLWYVTGRNLFGSQILYFLIQAAGLHFDRKILIGRGRAVRRPFAWLVVLGPVPLLINEGMLRILLLWPF